MPIGVNIDKDKNYFITIKPNAPADKAFEVEEIDVTPDLEKLQAGVGGDIEIVPYWTRIFGRRCIAFCHEQGKLEGLPINHGANILWRMGYEGGARIDDVLVGTIIVIIGSPSFLSKL
jgi:hypothetical protein